tara:strand:+ start:532 stop:780 length:249 start_codon:yes stop_codon:yes gene_type:complete
MTNKTKQPQYYLHLAFDGDDAFDVSDALEDKFEEHFSGSGCGGFRDIGFSGSEKDMLKIQKYAHKHFSRGLVDESLKIMEED